MSAGTASSREKGIYKVTIVGSIVNFVLVVLKFVAGILGYSAAMLADAVHSLSDFVTDVIVIMFVRISNKPQDKGHDYGNVGYGYYRNTTVICRLRYFVERCLFYLRICQRRTAGSARNDSIGCCSCFDFVQGNIISIYCC